MTLRAALLPVLVALLAGYVGPAGTEEKRAAFSSSFSSDGLSSSNCSQLTLKLDFSSKVVEHGECCQSLICFHVTH